MRFFITSKSSMPHDTQSVSTLFVQTSFNYNIQLCYLVSSSTIIFFDYCTSTIHISSLLFIEAKQFLRSTEKSSLCGRVQSLLIPHAVAHTYSIVPLWFDIESPGGNWEILVLHGRQQIVPVEYVINSQVPLRRCDTLASQLCCKSCRSLLHSYC